MNKETKRELKKQRKIIYIFLAVAFPIMLVVAFLLYRFAPSLVKSQWVVVSLIVVLGLIFWFAVQGIIKKQEEKNAKKPKKHDPFAD